MTRPAIDLDKRSPVDRELALSSMMLRIGLCLVALWAIYGLLLFEMRRHAWHEAEVAGANIATLVETAISREIEVYDLSIRAAATDAADPAILGLPHELQRKMIFDQSSEASLHGRLLLLDASGHVVASSVDDKPIGLDYSDRDYFAAQRDNRGAGLVIGGPLVSRITHKPSLCLSRRRPDVAGRFAGVVTGTIQLDFFNKLFESVRLPPGGSITLLKRDGTIMTRVPFKADFIGILAGGITTDNIMSGARAGNFTRVSSTDAVERLFSFHQVRDLPLFVNVGLSTREIFNTWRWNVSAMGIGFGLLSAIIVTLGLTLGAELKRRGLAERRLADLASTDHLTLLANRRRFDDVLDTEWRRGARSHQALSLLMIDCDHFKSYNDTYGHPAGDAVLRAIAAALRLCVDRPGDLVARVGGEEFAVILPATDESGAMTVAAALRAAIDALDLAHGVSPSGRLTVSVGLACMVPAAALSSTMLVAAADAALYRAKGEGRDRIVRGDRTTAAAEILRVA